MRIAAAVLIFLVGAAAGYFAPRILPGAPSPRKARWRTPRPAGVRSWRNTSRSIPRTRLPASPTTRRCGRRSFRWWRQARRRMFRPTMSPLPAARPQARPALRIQGQAARADRLPLQGRADRVLHHRQRQARRCSRLRGARSARTSSSGPRAAAASWSSARPRATRSRRSRQPSARVSHSRRAMPPNEVRVPQGGRSSLTFPGSRPSRSRGSIVGRAFAGVIDRRAFLKTSAAAVAVTVLPIAGIGRGAGLRCPRDDAAGGLAPTGAGRRRPRGGGSRASRRSPAPSSTLPISGPPTCPAGRADTAHALLLKTTDATHVFEGIDLSVLDPELTPDRVVLAADLARAGITVPGFYAGDLLCPAGKTPLYLGQPVALLIWNDFARFALAKPTIAVRRRRRAVRRRDRPGRREALYGRPLRARRRADAGGRGRLFADARRLDLSRSSTRRMTVRAGRCRRRPAPTRRRALILRRPDPGRDRRGRCRPLVLDRKFQTQSIDQVFMEPEAGLAWYDRATRKLELVIGVQSPQQAADERWPRWSSKNAGAQAVGSDRRPLRLCRRRLRRQGPHDLSRSMWRSPACSRRARPVRLANDRFEQFQFGIKRHAFTMRSRMAVDKASGRIAAFVAEPGSRRRRARQSLGCGRIRRRGGDRSAFMTCRRSTCRRWRGIAAPSPPARCAASAHCRR